MSRGPVAHLARQWSQGPGLVGWLTAVNHKVIGRRYLATALIFFLIAGIDSTAMRAQLAFPENELIGPDRYNALFTTHGTAMMFFFAIPFVEGAAIYLLPLMLGTRDLPFPRLNAFGYWLYLFGGALFYSSTLPDIVNFLWPGPEPVITPEIPDGGWFAYPPLTAAEFSPGFGIDFYLLGVTLAEIAALIAAVELIIAIFKTRAPGMTAMRMPIFAWSILVIAFAILFAFPAVVVASTFLELQRSIGMPFYDVGQGGDPILWQHLFWIFGHPEVYIIFLPATGIVSMIVPAFAGRPIIGYPLIVASLIATAVLSFGLWVHHMFAVGLPWLGLTFFSAASMLITIPSGVQVFAWIATLIKGIRLRITTAMLFVIGFVITFVLGGVTGVMVASVPFDLQVHDTYFIVAHFHYVLVGGAVLPFFAGVFYWFPKLTGRVLSERLGKWFFWLFFLGFNATFLPQHQLGLLGMRRRVWTYESDPWVDWLNLLSSAGQVLMIAGVLVLIAAIWRALRPAGTRASSDPWDGGTLEWSVESPPPSHSYGSIPRVGSREPLWDDPRTAEQVRDVPELGRAANGELPRTVFSEILVTGAIDARPESAAVLPSPTLFPLFPAVTLALTFAAVLFRLYPVAAVTGVVTVALLVWWAFQETPERRHREAWRTVRPPLSPFALGRASTIWWASLLGTIAVAIHFQNVLFSYAYLSFGAGTWPPTGSAPLSPLPAWLAAAFLAAGAVGAVVARRGIAAGDVGRLKAGLVGVVIVAAAGIVAIIAGLVPTGPSPTDTAYGAAFWAVVGFVAINAAVGLLWAAIVLVRAAQGAFDRERHAVVEGLVIWWAYAAIAAVIGFLLLQLTAGGA